MASYPMPDHARSLRRLFLGQRQELLCQLAADIAIEGQIVRCPEAIEDGEQYQRVFRGLSESFSPLHEHARPFERRLGFRGRVIF